MFSRIRSVSLVLLATALLGTSAYAQNVASRKLGPDTAKAISEAKLDPTFQTTKLDRVVVLPFANASQYKDAASIISKNLVSQLSQMHSDYKFITPEETINFISDSGLNDDFNVFLGDYLTSGTARTDFLASLRTKLQIDAVFVGHVTDWGSAEVLGNFLGLRTKQKVWIMGVDMSLYRTTDGRRIWYGRDRINAGKKERLPDAAQAISEVFARFFGRLAY